MGKYAKRESIDTATALFAMLLPKEQDHIIDLLKSLLSEQQSSSAAHPSVEKTS